MAVGYADTYVWLLVTLLFNLFKILYYSKLSLRGFGIAHTRKVCPNLGMNLVRNVNTHLGGKIDFYF